MRHVIRTVIDPETGKTYPIPAGGSSNEPPPTGEPGKDDGAPSIEGDPEALGDPGKKALDSMKAQWKAERDRAAAAEQASKAHADKIADLEASVAKFEGREAEFEAAQEAKKVQDEALAKANDRIRKAEVRAAAKGVLQDPSDAFVHLDLSTIEVGDDGEVDLQQVNDALTDLVEAKPYLAVQDERRFKGSADAGARNGSKASQLTRADLAGMSPEKIAEAKNDGQLDDLLGIKP